MHMLMPGEPLPPIGSLLEISVHGDYNSGNKTYDPDRHYLVRLELLPDSNRDDSTWFPQFDAWPGRSFYYTVLAVDRIPEHFSIPKGLKGFSPAYNYLVEPEEIIRYVGWSATVEFERELSLCT